MPIAAALPAVASAVGIAGSIYSATQNAKAANSAVNQQRGIVGDYLNNLKYEPIDIEKLKRDATAQAIQNATGSLALEKALQPNVASTRQELSRQVSSELAQGGNLPTDLANQVSLQARTANAGAGSQGNAAPVTAALLGLNSLNLAQQRKQNAAGLLAANPLQPTGLDPGSLASAEVAQNAAMNQFNIDKATTGANANLGIAQSAANARAGQIGGQVGMLSSIAGGLGGLAGGLGSFFGGGTTTPVKSAVPSYLSRTGTGFSTPFSYKSYLGATPLT